MKRCKRMIIMLFACLLLVGGTLPVYASEVVNNGAIDELTQLCESVFAVNLFFTDEQGEEHTVKTGTGFLIGSGEEASYVITGMDTIEVSPEFRSQILADYGLPEDADLQLVPGLVVKSDVIIEAEVVVSSEEMGFAVLKLNQPIHGREVLSFASDSESVQAMDTVYTLDASESVTEGQVYKWLEDKNSTLWHSAVTGEQTNGSPLVDEAGNVIGVNTKLLETGYVETTSSKEVVSVLEVFGIPYTMGEETTDISSNAQPEPGTDRDIPQPPQADTGAETRTLLLWLGFGIVVLLMVGVIILIFRTVAAEKKKNKEDAKVQNGQLPKNNINAGVKFDNSPVGYPQSFSGSSETNVVAFSSTSGGNETTMLSSLISREENTGCLIREKTGERIPLNKSLFIIGTDGMRADYCVSDNRCVSRVHAQIKRVNGEMVLENLKATNGTYLNGTKLQDTEMKPLHPGDTIRLADENFLFSM